MPEGLNRNEQRKYIYQVYLKAYLRCVAAIDENVGKLLAYLKKNGLSEDTVIIYTSDQGLFLGEHGYYDKRFIYEESIRMPFVVRYPREIKAGTVNDDIVTNIDFAPTFVDYAGQTVPDDIQGESFRSILANNKAPAKDSLKVDMEFTGFEEEIELLEINIEAVIEKPRVAILPKRVAPELSEMELINRSFEKELKKAPDKPMVMDSRLFAPKKIEDLKQKLLEKKNRRKRK